MLELNYLNFLNEEMSAISANKLRDAIHDIVVELSPKQIIEIEELSNILASEYRITISPKFIDKFLDEFIKVRKGNSKAKSFFTLKDSRWLGIRDVNGTKQIRNNLHFLAPSLGKHKQKLWKEDEKAHIENAYNLGMKELNFSEDIIKQTFVPQYPDDFKEMMKQIYKDVVINKKCANTLENCWKIMMFLGKSQRLDRKRNWFSIAPQKIKDYYKKTGRIDYTIEKASSSSYVKNKSPKSIPSKTNEVNNLKKVDNLLSGYENWDAIVNNVNKNEIIHLVDSLTLSKEIEASDIDIFLSKVEILTNLLIKYYKASEKYIYDFYLYIGLASMIKDWEKSGIKPKITDF